MQVSLPGDPLLPGSTAPAFLAALLAERRSTYHIDIDEDADRMRTRTQTGTRTRKRIRMRTRTRMIAWAEVEL